MGGTRPEFACHKEERVQPGVSALEEVFLIRNLTWTEEISAKERRECVTREEMSCIICQMASAWSKSVGLADGSGVLSDFANRLGDFCVEDGLAPGVAITFRLACEKLIAGEPYR
jgi:hypothetical protein